MLPTKSQSLICTAVRYLSTNGTKNATAVAVDAKDAYYQKIGKKVMDDESDIKPEGWNEAKTFSEVPGPKSFPILGNMWRFFPVIGEFYNLQLVDLHRRFKEQYGDIAYLGGIYGKRPMLFVYDPDNIEKVLRNEGPWPLRFGLPSFVYYRTHTRKDVFQGVGGVLSVQGEEWFNFRSIVNKILMQPRTAELYVQSMDAVANNFLDNIRYFINKNSEMPESFQNEIYKWALESMGVIAYNKRIGCLDRDQDKSALGQKLINSSLELFDLMVKLDILPSLWPIISTRNWRRYVQILDFITEVNQKFIGECLANADPNPDIPDHERSVLERLAKKDKKIATAMATDMIIAGVDTTGRTMGSALYFLAKNPDKQQALRNELRSYLPNKNSAVTKSIIREAPYLKAVIKETTRLAPVSVGILRTTVKDMVLSGYQIPKGTDVLSANILPSIDGDHFSNAKDFMPERWLRTTEDELSYKNTSQFASLPFGFGPRSCIGKRLATMELEVGLSKIIRNFKLSWHHPDAAFGTKLLYGVIDPLRLKIEEVNDSTD